MFFLGGGGAESRGVAWTGISRAGGGGGGSGSRRRNYTKIAVHRCIYMESRECLLGLGLRLSSVGVLGMKGFGQRASSSVCSLASSLCFYSLFPCRCLP